jgi:hypothetical protein
MEEQRGRTVSDAFGLERMNEAKVIDVIRHVREEFGDPASALTVLAEFPKRFHDALLRGFFFAAVGDVARVVEIKHLAVAFEKSGLVIERVEMARAALHENENDAVGFSFEMGRARGKRVCCRERLTARHAGEREIAKSACEIFQKVAAIQGGLEKR